MTPHQSNIIHTMIATLMGHVHHSEASKKTNKLRKSIRLKLNEINNKNREYYLKMANDSQKAWDSVEKELNDINYEVLLSVSLLALYSFIEHTPYKDSWFTERVFLDAIGSIEGCHRNPKVEDEAKVERDSNMVVELLCKAVGVDKPNTLSFLKLKIKNELLLDNIEYKEMVA